MYVCVGAYVRAGVCISTDSSVSVWFRNFGRLLTFDQQVLDDQMEEMHGLLLGCNAKKRVVMREVGVQFLLHISSIGSKGGMMRAWTLRITQ